MFRLAALKWRHLIERPFAARRVPRHNDGHQAQRPGASALDEVGVRGGCNIADGGQFPKGSRKCRERSCQDSEGEGFDVGRQEAETRESHSNEKSSRKVFVSRQSSRNIFLSRQSSRKRVASVQGWRNVFVDSSDLLLALQRIFREPERTAATSGGAQGRVAEERQETQVQKMQEGEKRQKKSRQKKIVHRLFCISFET
jgi:hypothetical protein